MRNEEQLHLKVCDYLRLQYPQVLFRTDMGGVKLTMGQAIKAKRMNGARRAWPDIFIAQPAGPIHGLFVELKNVNIYKKDGSLLANRHIEEQNEILKALRERGYKAEFAVGFDAARGIIDVYLSSEAAR